jgi:WD40 repeat protein
VQQIRSAMGVTLAWALGFLTLSSAALAQHDVSHGLTIRSDLPYGAINRFETSDLGHVVTISDLAFSPDGRLLASSDRFYKVCLWELRTGRQRLAFNAHRGGVGGLAFSPNARTLATAGFDTKVRLWDTRDGFELGQLDGPFLPLESVSFTPDGTNVVAGCRDRHVYMWDRKSGKLLGTTADLDGWGLAVGFLQEGREMAVLSNGGVRTVQILTYPEGAATEPLPRQVDPDSRVNAMVVSSDGQLLALAGEDQSIWVYDLKRRELLLQLTGHENTINDLAFSPDGQLLYSAGADQATRVWEIATGSQVLAVGGHTPNARGISAVATSVDGRRFASGGFDGQVVIWDLGMLLGTGLHGPIEQLAYDAWDEDGFVYVEPDASASGETESTPMPIELPDLETCWGSLTSQSGDEGQRGVWFMIAQPDTALPFLSDRLKPIQGGNDLDARIAHWIHQLGDDDFTEREQAAEALENVLDRAADSLRVARDESPSEEVQFRARFLLAGREGLRLQTDELRRVTRAIQVLEHIGSPKAVKVLERLASGTPDARQTRDAAAAIQRIQARRALAPFDRMSTEAAAP